MMNVSDMSMNAESDVFFISFSVLSEILKRHNKTLMATAISRLVQSESCFAVP